MGLSIWLAFKTLCKERLTSLAAVLGVAFGVATVTAVEVVDANTVRGAREYHRRESGDPDLELSIKDLSRWPAGKAKERLQAVPDIKALSPLSEAPALALAPGGTPSVVRLLALDIEAAMAFEPFALASGRLPQAPNEVLIGAALAEELKLGLESEIILRRPAVTLSGCADGRIVELEGRGLAEGEAAAMKVVGTLEKRWLGADHRGRVVIASTDGGAKVFQGAPVPTRFWVRLQSADRIAALRTALGADFELRVPTSRLIAASPEERAFRSGVRLASFLALGLGLFVIFHLLQLRVTAAVRQSGLLGALGLSAQGIGRTFLAQAFLIALVGTALGVALGIGIGAWLYEQRFTTLGWQRPHTVFSLAGADLTWIPLAGIASAMLGAVQPLARLRRVATLDALQQGEAALGQRETSRWVVPLVFALAPAALLGAAFGLRWLDAAVLRTSLALAFLFAGFLLVLFALPGLIARPFRWILGPLSRGRATVWLTLQGLPRNLKRYAGSIAGTSLIAAGLVSLQALTSSLQGETDAFAQRALPGHVFVYGPAVPEATMREITAVEGALQAYSIDADWRDAGLEVRGIPASALALRGLFDGDPERRSAFERGEGMVISTRAAKDFRLAEGSLWRTSPYGKPFELRILAVDDRHGFFPDERSYAVISTEAMRRIYCRTASHWSRVVVQVREGASEDAVAEAIRARRAQFPLDESLGRFTVVSAGQQREILRQEIAMDFAIFDVILVLSALLGALGLLNALVVTGLERTRELALLRAVGFSVRRVRTLFLFEASLVGGTGAILGSLLGLPFGALTVAGLAALSELDLPLDPPWLPALGTAFALTAVAFLAALLPAARAGRTDVVSALKSE